MSHSLATALNNRLLYDLLKTHRCKSEMDENVLNKPMQLHK